GPRAACGGAHEGWRSADLFLSSIRQGGILDCVGKGRSRYRHGPRAAVRQEQSAEYRLARVYRRDGGREQRYGKKGWRQIRHATFAARLDDPAGHERAVERTLAAEASLQGRRQNERDGEGEAR